MYAQAQQAALAVISLREPPREFSDLRYFSGRQDQPFRESFGPGFGTAANSPLAKQLGGPQPAGGGVGALNVRGLSIVKPPYSVISAISLEREMWSGRCLTAKRRQRRVARNQTLIILGDSQVTSLTHPRGAVWMPAPQSGSPMTYVVDGKQYIVVALSGGACSGEYLASNLSSAD